MKITLKALTLNVSLSKDTLTGGECPATLLTLTNQDGVVLELPAMIDRNNVVTMVLTRPGGTKTKRNPDQAAELRGEHVHERHTEMITLKPGASSVVPVSLCEWFGDLAEAGEYSIEAAYDGGVDCKAVSPPVKFTVIRPSVTSLVRADDGGRLMSEPRDLVWTTLPTGKAPAKNVVDLFLTRNDARVCEAILSSEFITQIPSNAAPRVSVPDVARGKFVAVMWPEGPGRHRMVKFDEFREPAGAQDILMPGAEFAPLGAPWCDADGLIWIFIRNMSGTEAGLITVPPTGTVGPARTWACPVPVPPQTLVRWGRTDAIHLVWAADVGGNVHCQSIPLSSPNQPPAVVLARVNAPERVVHARVDEVFDAKLGVFIKFYTLLVHDDVRDMFFRRRLDQAGQLLKEEGYLVPGSGFWTVIDSAMLADDTVAYLFADSQGHVKFGGTDLSRWQPLTGVFTEPLHVSTKPCLMPAGFDPRGAQFYLAFIAEGNRIERRKLGR